MNLRYKNSFWGLLAIIFVGAEFKCQIYCLTNDAGNKRGSSIKLKIVFFSRRMIFAFKLKVFKRNKVRDIDSLL